MRKIVELLLYLAHKRQDVDHYKACKLVYLADWLHLNRYGRPLAADIHEAMEWGPVASKTYELLKEERPAMADAGLTELPFETYKLDKIIYLGAPKRAVDKSFFSRSDLEVFDEVIEKYGDCSFKELHDLTSKHFAYRNAWNNKPATRGKATMSYDDMLEESAWKEEYIDDLSPVSHKM